MPERLCLVAVHAHPDDESSKGAGTVARYHDEGVHTVLVSCTGGEEGEILNPAMDRPGVLERMKEIRAAELDAAAAVIGYDEVVRLGYRDSGMPGRPSNDHPDSFARAPLEEAVGRLVAVLRRVRPQVVLTYHEDQEGYPHPDHLRVHEISVAAFDASGEADRFPGTGDAWQPSKLYYNVWSPTRMLAMHAKLEELGIASPFDAQFLERLREWAKTDRPDLVTTRIDVAGHQERRREALLAHATQIDPTAGWFFGIPPEVARTLEAGEEWQLARNLAGPIEQEDDLFAGLRGAPVGSEPG